MGTNYSKRGHMLTDSLAILEQIEINQSKTDKRVLTYIEDISFIKIFKTKIIGVALT